MSYFEDGGTLPPPFNLFPTTKLLRCSGGKRATKSLIVSNIFSVIAFNGNRFGRFLLTHTIQYNYIIKCPQFEICSIAYSIWRIFAFIEKLPWFLSKINTNDSSNPLDKQFIGGIRCWCIFFSRLSLSSFYLVFTSTVCVCFFSLTFGFALICL